MTTPFEHKSYDAIIIGARCAGGATGMLLARSGLKVLIVDRETTMGDTLSTHAIMRPGVSLLARWGLLDRVLDTTPVVSETRFQYGTEEITVPVKPIPGVPGLVAPRRWVLDQIIIDAARTAGADVQFGQSFVDVERDAFGEIAGVTLQDHRGDIHSVKTGFIIGADGRRSTVADKVGATTRVKSNQRGSVVYTYMDGIPNMGYRWFFEKGQSGGIIPTSHGQSCVFAGCRPADFSERFCENVYVGLAQMFAEWDDVVSTRLLWKDIAEKPRKFAGAPGHMKQCVGRGWALVGDAGYFKDPATAHGITDAFLDAQRLAGAFIARPDDISGYEAERNTSGKALFEITQDIASFDWDFDQLKDLHTRLSASMKAEQQTLQTHAAAQAA